MSALVFGAERIDGVEINPIIADDVMRDRFREYSGGIYTNPRVRITIDDGRSFWEHVGIFTLATQFGDDGSKGGELEALLEQVDPELMNSANREGGGSKPRAGAYFAAYHLDPPDLVLALYKKIADYLGLQ